MLALIVNAQTPPIPAAPNPKAKTKVLLSPRASQEQIIKVATIIIQPKTFTIAWIQNYSIPCEGCPTNIYETSLVLTNADMSIPISQWNIAFVGVTNQATFPMSQQHEMFAAANIWTNS
jgi:hypothetical protein